MLPVSTKTLRIRQNYAEKFFIGGNRKIGCVYIPFTQNLYDAHIEKIHMALARSAETKCAHFVTEACEYLCTAGYPAFVYEYAQKMIQKGDVFSGDLIHSFAASAGYGLSYRYLWEKRSQNNGGFPLYKKSTSFELVQASLCGDGYSSYLAGIMFQRGRTNWLKRKYPAAAALFFARSLIQKAEDCPPYKRESHTYLCKALSDSKNPLPKALAQKCRSVVNCYESCML